MEKIQIKRPSAKQIAKLLKGHKVRIMKGGDLSIYVQPHKIDKMSRSFLKGKGIHLEMSPEEIAHNSSAGDLFKKAKKFAVNSAKKLGRKAIKAVGPEVAGTFGSVLGAVAPAMLGNPELSPFAAMAGKQLGEAGANYLGKTALSSLRTHKQNRNQPRSRGNGNDPLQLAGIANKEADAEAAYFRSLQVRQMDDQAPAPLARRHEVSSIGVGGSLLSLPPALRSQPYSANFQFRYTLPPAFQNISKNAHGGSLGSSLYSGRSAGLYASSARGMECGSLYA